LASLRTADASRREKDADTGRALVFLKKRGRAKVVLPGAPGGSPAAGKRQINPGAPGPARNNDLPYGFLASANSFTDPSRREKDAETGVPWCF